MWSVVTEGLWLRGPMLADRETGRTERAEKYVAAKHATPEQGTKTRRCCYHFRARRVFWPCGRSGVVTGKDDCIIEKTKTCEWPGSNQVTRFTLPSRRSSKTQAPPLVYKKQPKKQHPLPRWNVEQLRRRERLPLQRLVVKKMRLEISNMRSLEVPG